MTHFEDHMRVRTRKNFEKLVEEDDPRSGISYPGEYFVVGVSQSDYRIINDTGEPVLYLKRMFELVDPEVPRGWYFTEYPDGEYYLEPAAVSVPGFYEDYFGSDGDRLAQAEAKRVLRNVLETTLSESHEVDARILRGDLARLR